MQGIKKKLPQCLTYLLWFTRHSSLFKKKKTITKNGFVPKPVSHFVSLSKHLHFQI